MFGYIQPYKPELKIKDYEYYKSVYCGICHEIKKIGNIPRMFLNYDFVFLYLILKEHFDIKENSEKRSCIVHPFKKRSVISSNEILKYVANQTIILASFKLYDDYIDNRDLNRGLMYLLLNLYLKKARDSDYKSKFETIKAILKKQTEFEKNGCDNLDIVAHNFGELLSFIFGYNNDDNLKQIGYYTGIWIYIVDAIDDYIDDVKKKRYNCLKYYLQDKKDKESFEAEIKVLEITLNNYLARLNELLAFANDPIVQNIVQMGMYSKTISVLNKLKESYEELILK